MRSNPARDHLDGLQEGLLLAFREAAALDVCALVQLLPSHLRSARARDARHAVRIAAICSEVVRGGPSCRLAEFSPLCWRCFICRLLLAVLALCLRRRGQPWRLIWLARDLPDWIFERRRPQRLVLCSPGCCAALKCSMRLSPFLWEGLLL